MDVCAETNTAGRAMSKIRWDWCLRWGILIGLIAGLMFLLGGCVYYAVNGVDPSAIPGERLIRGGGTTWLR